MDIEYSGFDLVLLDIEYPDGFKWMYTVEGGMAKHYSNSSGVFGVLQGIWPKWPKINIKHHSSSFRGSSTEFMMMNFCPSFWLLYCVINDCAPKTVAECIPDPEYPEDPENPENPEIREPDPETPETPEKAFWRLVSSEFFWRLNLEKDDSSTPKSINVHKCPSLEIPPTHISKYWKLIICIFKRKVKKNFTLEHFSPLKTRNFLQPWWTYWLRNLMKSLILQHFRALELKFLFNHGEGIH